MSTYSSLPQSEIDSFEELQPEKQLPGILSSDLCHGAIVKLKVPQTLFPKTYKRDDTR